MIFRRCRQGFTLIELLVVMTIGALITGMIVTIGPRQSRGQVVQMAAEQVAALLRRARAMAIANNSPYMVTFNLENAPGSSGKVINNRSGGHWCRIVRPGRTPIGYESFYTELPPLIAGGAGAGSGYPWCTWTTAGGLTVTQNGSPPVGLDSGGNRVSIAFNPYPTFAHVVEEIRSGYVSERVTLPAGRARFLALGDSDEGPRMTSVKWSCDYGTTYPRPYFGFFDPSSKRLYPWGGYDPNLPVVTPWNTAEPADPLSPPPAPFSTYSGLFYQGKDEALPPTGCVNRADRKFDVDWNRDGVIAGSDAERGAENNWYLLREGQPRPLINGDWGDFTILFNQDGTAVFPAMKCNRRWYTTPSDLAKYWSIDRKSRWEYSPTATAPNGESIHYQRHTNRAFITIAPDSPDDRDQFASPNEALRTLLPMCRVFVTTAGYVGITPVRWNENVLSELPAQDSANPNPWPSDPAIFSMATVADRDWMDANFRYGWMHSPLTRGAGSYWGSVPRGKPITDQVSTAMMTRRIWWMVP